MESESVREIERNFLSGLLKYQHIFYEIDAFVDESNFLNSTHKALFLIMKSFLSKGEEIDPVIITQKMFDLNITNKDGVDILDYVESFLRSSITEKGTLKMGQELAQIKFRRDLYRIGKNISKLAQDSRGEKVEKILLRADELYADKLDASIFDDKPHDLFLDMEEIIEEIGNNPVEEAGVSTCFPEFNNFFGGLRKGHAHAIASRPGSGKSTFLNEICMYSAMKHKTKVLFLDTEMSTLEVQERAVASLSGVPYWYIETGNWRKDKEMVEKIRKVWPKVKSNMQNFYFHQHVGNKDVSLITSLIRKWYFLEVGRGNNCVIAYDYIKLTGEKVDRNWAEYQAIGDKIDKLKTVVRQIDAPLMTAMQLNRYGESYNKKSSDVTDDSTVISLSDRLQWFANLVCIFRKKTSDELTQDGNQFGTHKLIPVKTRFQGREAAGHSDMLRRPTGPDDDRGVLVPNYINYDIENFKVTERGSLRDIIANERMVFEQGDGNNDDDDMPI